LTPGRDRRRSWAVPPGPEDPNAWDSGDADLAVLRDLAPKTVVLGVLDLENAAVESADEVAGRIRAALRHVPLSHLVPARTAA
jgi:methionine synthase II (cobalamin-independent)